MTKTEMRKQIEFAKAGLTKPIRKVTKQDELMELSHGDYTDYSMRCSESGITEFGEDRNDLMGY